MTAPAPKGTRAAAPGPLNPLLTEHREYPFVTLDQRCRELVPANLRPIDFGLGDPRERTPEFIREALRRALPEVSSYPSAIGKPELRAACAAWLERRFGVRLDPERQVLPANGTKEAVFSLALAVVGRGPAGARAAADPRRLVVIPSPAYPVYESGARFAGAEPHLAPLSRERGWRFEPDQVGDEVWARTALLWLGSPHNPTGAVLDRAALARVLETAHRFGFWVAADEAYCEIYFGVDRPASMLEVGIENVIALHTLSKRSAMTGFRSGFMAGDERLISALRRFRPNLGTATPDFVQAAAVAAWNDDAHPETQRRRYAEKRSMLLDYFQRRGWRVEASEASFYLWMNVPEKVHDARASTAPAAAARQDADDVEFVDRLLRVGIVAMPGSYLGPGGEGYVRWALVPTPEDCREAIERLEGVVE